MADAEKKEKKEKKHKKHHTHREKPVEVEDFIVAIQSGNLDRLRELIAKEPQLINKGLTPTNKTPLLQAGSY